MTSDRRQPQVVVLGGGSWGPPSRPSALDAGRRCSGCARRTPRRTSTPTTATPSISATRSSCREPARDQRFQRGRALRRRDRHGRALARLPQCADRTGQELRPWVPVVSLVKGLEQGTNMRMSQIVEEVLPGHPAGILAGPNIAKEVAEGTPPRPCWPCPTATWPPTWPACSAPAGSAPTPATTWSVSRSPER